MYMIEITEDKLHTMAEHVEHGLRHMGKLMQCLESLEEEFSSEGAYGEKGRLGLRENDSEDWLDEDNRKYRDRMRYGKRVRRY